MRGGGGMEAYTTVYTVSNGNRTELNSIQIGRACSTRPI